MKAMNQFDINPFPGKKSLKHLFLKKSEKTTLSHAKLPPLPPAVPTKTTKIIPKKVIAKQEKSKIVKTTKQQQPVQSSEDDDSVVNLAYD